MHSTIRAKFRCMGVKLSWDGYAEVALRPVMGSKGNSEENKRFFEATPNGEAVFTMIASDGPLFVSTVFKPGAFYYIDMVQADGPAKNGWVLYEKARRSDGRGSVNLQPFVESRVMGLPLWGCLKMDLTVPQVIEMFGEPGMKWMVAFSEAPADPA